MYPDVFFLTMLPEKLLKNTPLNETETQLRLPAATLCATERLVFLRVTRHLHSRRSMLVRGRHPPLYCKRALQTHRADWSGRQRCFEERQVKRKPESSKRAEQKARFASPTLFSNYICLTLPPHGYHLLLTFLLNLFEAVGSGSSSLKERNSTVLNEIKGVSSHRAGGRARPRDFNRVTGRLLSLTTKSSLQPSSPNRTGSWTRVWVCVGAVEFQG